MSQKKATHQSANSKKKPLASAKVSLKKAATSKNQKAPQKSAPKANKKPENPKALTATQSETSKAAPQKKAVSKSKGQAQPQKSGSSSSPKSASRSLKESHPTPKGRPAKESMPTESQSQALKPQTPGKKQSQSLSSSASAQTLPSPAVGDSKNFSTHALDEDILRLPDGRPYCKVKDCDQPGLVDGYCRYHYMVLWKKIQVRRRILSDGTLERYVEELANNLPDKYLELIKKDLSSERNFTAVIREYDFFEAQENLEDEDQDIGSTDVDIDEVNDINDSDDFDPARF